jgi:hypothetical protein
MAMQVEARGSGPAAGASMRRRWLAVAVILTVALAGALLNQMSVVRHDALRPTPPGPLDALPL